MHIDFIFCAGERITRNVPNNVERFVKCLYVNTVCIMYVYDIRIIYKLL